MLVDSDESSALFTLRTGRVISLLSVAVSLALAIPVTSAEHPKSELPAPPAGFSWKQVKEIRAAFLVPDGWHFESEKQGGTLAYFITPEKFDKKAGFSTGLTINVFKKLKDRNAVTYAHDYIAKMAATYQVVHQWETSLGEMQGYGCQVKLPGEGKYPESRTHYLAIASKLTNTLYILFFEAPETEWEAAWSKGQRMLEIFVVDNEV